MDPGRARPALEGPRPRCHRAHLRTISCSVSSCQSNMPPTLSTLRLVRACLGGVCVSTAPAAPAAKPAGRDAGFVQAAPPVREVASAAAPGPAVLELVKTLRGPEEPILSRSEADHSFGSVIPRERRRHPKPSEGQRRRRGQLGRALRWGPRPGWEGRRVTARPRAALYPECVDGREPRAPCPLLSPAGRAWQRRVAPAYGSPPF